MDIADGFFTTSVRIEHWKSPYTDSKSLQKLLSKGFDNMKMTAASEQLPELNGTDMPVIALAGMPNVGKSTVFNALTGLHQHTGNWAGKTVASAIGVTICGGRPVTLVDLPGTYSLRARSAEEAVARDFLCFGTPDATVVVCDATCLERGLTLAIQVLETTPRVLLCVNLLDEAESRGIHVDLEQLEQELGIPVAGVTARSGIGLDVLKQKLDALLQQEPSIAAPYSLPEEMTTVLQPILDTLPKELHGLPPNWTALRLMEPEPELHQQIAAHAGFSLTEGTLAEALQYAHNIISAEAFADQVIAAIVTRSEVIAAAVVQEPKIPADRDRRIDRILTGRMGLPIMLILLGLILWITIVGANYPSAWLSAGFAQLKQGFSWLLESIHTPHWLYGLLVDGIYTVLTWVISVMLPPMAIFFPLFTLLEDFGYLPRVAFNLDKRFQHACACGKQSLTMCMGFGCNAAGITGCRIIDSPRERLIAILTNNFVPCNGRFPTMITCITLFFAVGSGLGKTLSSAAMLLGLILLGIFVTFAVSRLLSRTILRGVPSSFTLELPPYRKPQVGRVLVRSILDRTIFVLGRACLVAAPAGALLWIFANCRIGGANLLTICADFLDTPGKWLGMDGTILLAFLLGFPANEIVLPIALMCYTAETTLTETGSLGQIHMILTEHGWTWVTALCVLLFILFHFPCSTTCLTILKETKSWKWTIAAFCIPTITGILFCSAVSLISRLVTSIF